MSKFDQMRVALSKVMVSAEDVLEASPRLVGDSVAAGPVHSVSEESPAERDHDETLGADVPGVPSIRDGRSRRRNREPPTLTEEPDLPLGGPHIAAYRLGGGLFGYEATRLPTPRGLIIGECPGSGTDPRLPMFPYPANSSASRLLDYSCLQPAEYLGLAMRTNLCLDEWFDEIAVMRVDLLKMSIARYDRGLRVLLLGTRVARAWRVGGRAKFGVCTLFSGDSPISVAWIPHPSGLNRLYNDHSCQREAGRYVRWVTGKERL